MSPAALAAPGQPREGRRRARWPLGAGGGHWHVAASCPPSGSEPSALLRARPHAAAAVPGRLGADPQPAPGTGCRAGTAPGGAEQLPLPAPSPRSRCRGPRVRWPRAALGGGTRHLQPRGTHGRSWEPHSCSKIAALATDAPCFLQAVRAVCSGAGFLASPPLEGGRGVPW